jgi:elongation factor 2 kinase
MQLTERPNQPIVAVERYISGNFMKYSDNFGYVKGATPSPTAPTQKEEYRQTPQAFSHFSWENSQHRYIVVDIQGVGDMYTDPQIQSLVKLPSSISFGL